ncbi:hypothetical protein ACFT5C_03695 [Streptomyces sp. NPDC057116]|uniref:hypothetical protein n=1 Tax=Streptomyces sp. NPDC057116 TaxID=3346023 RepID=UPI003627FF2B
MTLPKPLKVALLLLGVYVVAVLLFRFGRNGMEWDRALLVSLVVAPVALLWGHVRDRINKGAEKAGRRWRAKRRA